jgi:SAM-dependent methyltransferase
MKEFQTGKSPSELPILRDSPYASGSAFSAVSGTSRFSGDILRWSVPDALAHSPSILARNVFAARIREASVPWVINEFCRCDVEKLVRRALTRPFEARGVGIELGSGSGVLGALIARAPAVQTVYAIEASEEMHRHVARRVAREILGADNKKIVSVLGTFDNIHLPDRSVDFALNQHSLHHSDDLSGTLREVARVLKPGGWLLSYDRVRADTMTDEEIEALLSRQYSEKWLSRNGYPAGLTLRRRENGEHEIRLREWREAFASAGLTIVALRPPEKAIPWKQAAKGFLSLTPRFLTRAIYRTENANWHATAAWLRQCAKRTICGSVYFRPGERPSTVIVGQKEVSPAVG